MSHQRKLLAVLLGTSIAGAAVAAYGANVLAISSIKVHGISQQETCEYVYFTTSEEASCGGVRIAQDGDRRRITFIREGADVDVEAVFPNDHAFEGCLRVEVPLSESLLADGGSMTLVFADAWSERGGLTSIYPPRKLSYSVQPANRATPGR